MAGPSIRLANESDLRQANRDSSMKDLSDKARLALTYAIACEESSLEVIQTAVSAGRRGDDLDQAGQQGVVFIAAAEFAQFLGDLGAAWQIVDRDPLGNRLHANA